jgi:glutaredoxin-like YruB-family protein
MEGKKVVVYSTPTCPWCEKLKDYLDKRGVKYKDIDVSGNMEAAREMIKKSGQMGVPQIEINGKIIVGFDREEIEAALAG